MKNITFSADERLIEAARERARSERSTLNEQFRQWLQAYVGSEQLVATAESVINDLRTKLSTSGRRFTREEMIER